MSGFIEDVRVAVRVFLRSPAFTLTAVLTLAVGLGATTAVFALVNGLLLRPLPVERQAELAELSMERTDGSGRPLFSYPQYLLLHEHAPGLSGLAAQSFKEYGVRMAGAEPRLQTVYEVSGNYFAVLGVQPLRGRFFADEVGRPGGDLVTVISHEFWVQHFGGADEAVGSTLLVNGQALAIIGVAPRGFRGTMPVLPARLWVPLTAVPTLNPGTNFMQAGMSYPLTLIGRLAPGTSRQQAEALLSSAVRALESPDSPEPFTTAIESRPPVRSIELGPLRGVPGAVAGATFGFMGLLFITAAFVLLIAAVNITNMMLARATTRARELGVRQSLGATRGRIIRQLLTENVILFSLGACAGLLVAVWLTATLPALTASLADTADIDTYVQLDASVFGFALATALVLAVPFGLAPALHAIGEDLMGRLREGMPPLRGTRLRSGFIVGQFALSLLLLITAGLLGRALERGLTVDPGFTAAGVAVAELELRPYGYEPDAARTFLTQLRQRLTARGDVTAAGIASTQPLVGWTMMHVRPEGHDAAPAGGVLYQSVDGGYLAALHVPLRAGRYFDERDHAGAPAVALVNEAFVDRFWPGENPIGRRIFEGADSHYSYEIVGVVATGRYRSLSEAPQPFFYRSINQHGVTSATVFARGSGGQASVQKALREEIQALDANLPVRATSLQRNVSALLTPQRVAAATIGAFGVLGLLLAGIGIYGIVAFTAAQRAREIGVRMALGARRRTVIGLFMRQGAKLLVIGAVIGLALALVTGRLLSVLLHGISPADPLTLLAATLLLAAVALLAAYLPAHRASRTDPMIVLRTD